MAKCQYENNENSNQAWRKWNNDNDIISIVAYHGA